jgi:hypothetical protein
MAGLSHYYDHNHNIDYITSSYTSAVMKACAPTGRQSSIVCPSFDGGLSHFSELVPFW